MDRADEAARLRALRRVRGRLGCDRRRPAGGPGPARAARHPHEHARRGSSRAQCRGPVGRSRAGRPRRGGDRRLRQAEALLRDGRGLRQEMGTHPQTLYGIADSPVGLAAWMIDHDLWSMQGVSRVFDGDPDDRFGLSRDDVLDNIILYWLTNTSVSSGRIYRENTLGFFDVKGVSVPTAVSVFPDEIYAAP